MLQYLYAHDVRYLNFKKENKMKVENMTSNKGNSVPNQFIIYTNDGIYFQSYNSIICKRTENKVFLDSYYWDYSSTTAKYRRDFLNGEGVEATRKKIKSGEYILTDLNNGSV